MELVGERVLLRELEPRDAARVAAYHRDNAARHAPWSPPRPHDFATRAYWARRLEAGLQASAEGSALRLHMLLRHDPDGPVIGEASLSQIVRGPFLNAFLGYSIDHRHEGRGLMTEALRLLVAHAFGPMGLHRIQANFVPENARSARVLQRLRFATEGLARDYLFIGGAWRDHVLTALTCPEHPGPS